MKKADRLYNIIGGMGAAFNIMPRPAGNLLGDRPICQSAREAFREDWGAVGHDLEMACRTLAETLTDGVP
jgi:hypothetical protein